MEQLLNEAVNGYDFDQPEAFQQLFEQFYSPLCNYAFAILRDEHDAEDVVQALFIELWEKQPKSSIPPAPQYFLLRATKNRAIDHLRRRTKEARISAYLSVSAEHVAEPGPTDHPDPISSLTEFLPYAIDRLPPKTREVFLMSRQEDKSYKEIAAALEISIKTVENQMGRAFRLLREFFAGQKKQIDCP